MSRRLYAAIWRYWCHLRDTGAPRRSHSREGGNLEFLHLGLANARFLLTDRPNRRYLPPEPRLRRLPCPTISRIQSSPYLKLLSMPSCGRFAVSAPRPQGLPLPGAGQVCLKLTWHTTYSRRPAPPCTFPRSWRASTPPSTSPSIARAWSLR